MSDFWIPVAALLGLLTVVFTIVFAVSYQVDKSRCSEWSQITNRETRFEKTTALTWDCFTPDDEGRWLPINQVRDIG